MALQDIIDRLPFPLNVALFGAEVLAGGILLTGVVFGASLALQGNALTDQVKETLKAIGEFFQWLFELPGTGEEVKA